MYRTALGFRKTGGLFAIKKMNKKEKKERRKDKFLKIRYIDNDDVYLDRIAPYGVHKTFLHTEKVRIHIYM
jgi:hypothetical protein